MDSVKSELGVARHCVIIQISVCSSHQMKVAGMLILELLMTTLNERK